MNIQTIAKVHCTVKRYFLHTIVIKQVNEIFIMYVALHQVYYMSPIPVPGYVRSNQKPTRGQTSHLALLFHPVTHPPGEKIQHMYKVVKCTHIQVYNKITDTSKLGTKCFISN